MTQPLDALFLALEDDPADPVTLHALADWFEEHDRPGPARALHWVASRGLRPFRYSRDRFPVSSGEFHDGWYWWATGEPGMTAVAADWGLPASCCLPPPLWRAMRHSFRYQPAMIKEYPTPRLAYEALIDAWPLVLPGEEDAA